MSAPAPLPPIRHLALPPGVETGLRVYVNGEPWTEGIDYRVEQETLHLMRPLRPQPPLSLLHKILLSCGIGVYGDLRGDTLDLHYRSGGQDRMVNVPLPAQLAQNESSTRT